MADNVGYTPGSGAVIAADDIGGVLHQRVKIGVGGDGTAVDVSSTNPMPVVGSDPSATTSFGPVTTASTVLFASVDTANERTVILQLGGSWLGSIGLQASQDSTTWFDCTGLSQNNETSPVSQVFASDVITVPVIARFFRAVTSTNFVGSVSGVYSLRALDAPPFFQEVVLTELDPQVSVPVAGVDQSGHVRRVGLNEFGHVLPADGRTLIGSLSRIGTIWLADTTGYNSIVVQIFTQVAGTFTVSFQVSNDSTAWTAVAGWPVGGAAAPITTTTALGQWVFPCIGKFFRVQVTAYTSGVPAAIGVLKSTPAFFPPSSPSIAANSGVNIGQINGTATVTAGVAGMLAVGGNIAEDNAATSNPIISGGVVRTALPASTVVAGDAIRATYSASGQMITKENAPGDLDFYANATVTTNTQTAIRGAQAGGIRQNVTGITFQNTNATATTLTIQDGATTLITFSVPASMTLPVQLNFPTPLRGTAATALNYTAGTAGANVLLNVIGFNSY
jgi:hypothetical protein